MDQSLVWVASVTDNQSSSVIIVRQLQGNLAKLSAWKIEMHIENGLSRDRKNVWSISKVTNMMVTTFTVSSQPSISKRVLCAN